MILTSRNTFLFFICVVHSLGLVKSTCIRDEEGNVVEKPKSGLGGFLQSVGCSVEKGVRKIGDGAKSLGSDIKEAVKGGISAITQSFQSNRKEDNQFNQQYPNYQTDPNNQANVNQNYPPNNNYGNTQQQGIGQPNRPEISTLPYESLIDVRAQEIFETGTDYLSSTAHTERPSEVTKDPTSLDERFLLNSPKICPEGFKKDRHDICREV